jgi:hypothetical protein
VAKSRTEVGLIAGVEGVIEFIVVGKTFRFMHEELKNDIIKRSVLSG